MEANKELNHYATLLSKINNKKYESYVVSRIVHLLNDPEIQFIPQQLVRKPDGKRYLIDLYFPQFKLAVEIDEPYHNSQVEEDELREREIIELTNSDFRRINCGCEATLHSVHKEIDELINEIREFKKKTVGFEPYSYNNEYSVAYWLRRGQLSVEDNAKFRTHVDVLKLFNLDFGSHQRVTSPLSDRYQVWFPKLYKNKEWDNSITSDGKVIRQAKINNAKMQYGKIRKYSYVFAHETNVLGETFYKYKGLYECIEETEYELKYSRVENVLDLSNYKS
jgi:hypothetical protein